MTNQENLVQTPNMLAAALVYVGSNLPVFPLNYPVGNGGCSCRNPACQKVGKHPMTIHGVKNATTDRQTVMNWWGENPLANIGMPTGFTSGLVVIDIDHRHGALETLERLEKRIGTLPATLISRTGAGLHYFYKYPGVMIKSRTGVLGPGIDVRGDGGYVVVPPSLHVNGRRYEWLGSATK